MNPETIREADETSVGAKTIVPCESKSVTLKSTYIPDVEIISTPVAASNRREARYNSTLKILLFLYASLMFLKLIETLNDCFTTMPQYSKKHYTTSIDLTNIAQTLINVAIMITAFASCKTLTVVSIESIIGLCFIQLLFRLIAPRFWATGALASAGSLGSLDTWTLLTAAILVVCLLIFKDIRKNNRNIERWAYVLFKEFSGPIPLKLSLKRSSSPSDKV